MSGPEFVAVLVRSVRPELVEVDGRLVEMLVDRTRIELIPEVSR